jgi:cell division protein FtsQ
VNITGDSKFEIVPLIGDQLILLGDADQLDKKFRRLKAFYEQALMQQGMNTYEKLDIRFDKQVVAVRRDYKIALIDVNISANNNKGINKPLTIQLNQKL